jgi:cytoskeletal protein RodZ
MFELGASLRDARRKRGLELDAVQRATRIRRRYLEAMEEERFDVLPGVAYARGFLREYAEFLGLDGGLYVDEYNERFAPRDEAPAIAPRRSVPGRGRVAPAALLAGGVLLAVALAVGLAAWKLSGGSAKRPAATPSTAAAVTPRHPKRKHVPATTRPAAPAPLVLTAARGDSWILVRLGSETGRVLYERVLRQGSTIRFGLARPLWVRVGAGLNLDAHVGTKPLQLPHMVGNVLVNPAGG